jgi:hypothetical protein
MNGKVRRKAVWGSGIALAAILSSLLFAGCGDLVREGHAPAALLMDSLAGASGQSGDFGPELESDVLTGGTRFADAGQAAMRLVMKDPVSATSPLNGVTLTRYRVAYTRTDGRNTPGVDVPHPFDGMVTATIAPGETQALAFTLVRAQAKLEAPLLALAGGGGAFTIVTIAEVTFYGHDQTGRAVSSTGRITVQFADWGD